MQWKDLAAELNKQSAEPLEGTVVNSPIKKRLRAVERGVNVERTHTNTFVIRTVGRPPRILYRKNVKNELAQFMESEVPPRVLENIRQKM